MIIPKDIKAKLERRAEYAEEIMNLTTDIDNWLLEHGADFSDFELNDSVQSGCYIVWEPRVAVANIEEYIKEKM